MAGAILTVACLVLALGVSRAEAKTVWLCKPGLDENPCETGLRTTAFSPTEGKLGVERPKAAKRPKIDCFYVYPTVSDDEGSNSDREIDPEERSIALYQAARYSQHCRVFAPVYRQITLSGILGGQPVTAEMARLAYGDVLEAWETYLKKFNDGRGVVFVGHSQGTFVLRNLIAREVDPRKSMRKRLVSALLFGGDVLVARDQLAGGDFQRIPACRSSRQTRCVIAFSTFNGPVPPDALFGRPGSRSGGDPATQEVLCTDPTALRDRMETLRLVVPSEPFAPGTTIGAATEAVGLPRPEVSTPWIELRNAYAGECSAADDANVLQVVDLPGATHLNPVPNETWGLHLVDANIALGNLVEVVADQARAFARAKEG
jgi:hypothetical protein